MNNDVIETCLICESDSLKPLKNYEKDHLVRCRQCSFVFSRLRPTEDELNQTYAAYQRGSNRKAGPINAENVSAQAQALVSGNKVVNLIKSGINGVLSLAGLGTSIVAVYRKT